MAAPDSEAAAQSREYVARVVDALESRNDSLDVTEQTHAVPPARYEFTRSRIEATTDDPAVAIGPTERFHAEDSEAETPHAEDGAAETPVLGGAGVWLAREDGAVLLVRRTDETGWGAPVGTRYAGETVAATARRELREETGLDCRLAGVQSVLLFDVCDERDPARPALRDYLVVFDGREPSGSRDPESDEIVAADWFHSHPETVVHQRIAERPIPVTDAER